MSRAAEVRYVSNFLRCMCPECVALDVIYPDEGYQLGFWRWAPVDVPREREKKNATLGKD
jgi:hypothetical protein